MFGVRRFENELTAILTKEPNYPLSKCIFHPELAATVIREAEPLVDYLCSDWQGEARCVTLAKWALHQEWEIVSDFKTFKREQPSVNATQLLSSPNRRLWERLTNPDSKVGPALFNFVLHFLDDPVPPVRSSLSDREDFRLRPTSAGHFQRIFEHFLRQGESWIPQEKCQNFYKQVLDFSIKHVDILAYRELLGHLAVDAVFVPMTAYSAAIPDDSLECLFREILSSAMAEVAVLEKGPPPNEASTKETVTTSPGSASVTTPPLDLSFLRASNPVSIDGTSLEPPPQTGPGRRPPPRDGTVYTRRLQERLSRFEIAPADSDFEDAKVRAYLLLSAIQELLSVIPENLTILQRISDGKVSPLELLLAIGVYADSASMVAPVAFRLVRLIAGGYPSLSWVGRSMFTGEIAEEPDVDVKGLEGTEQYEKLVMDYAPDFLFDLPMTNQMIAAFPTFWNFRNPNFTPVWITSAGTPLAKLAYNYVDREGNPIATKWEYTLPPGFTPMEAFVHTVFYDEPMSDLFNRFVLGILNRYDKESKTLKGKVDDSIEHQKCVFERDIVVLNILRIQFKWLEGSADIRALKEKVIPLRPIDPFYSKKSKEQKRTVLNGAIVGLFLTFLLGEFFTWHTGFTPMINDVGLSDVERTVTQYQRMCESEMERGTHSRMETDDLEDSADPPTEEARTSVRETPNYWRRRSSSSQETESLAQFEADPSQP
jgi:hypothetical protein